MSKRPAMSQEELAQFRKKTGRKSKNKGYRGEVKLVKHLQQRGWTALRMPGSGAIPGFDNDVVAEKNGRKVPFEVKWRAEQFNAVYALYEEHRKTCQDDVMALALPGAQTLCITVSDSVDALFESLPEFHLHIGRHPLYEKHKRTFGRFATFEKWLKGAQVLAICGDRKPFLFIRYR